MKQWCGEPQRLPGLRPQEGAALCGMLGCPLRPTSLLPCPALGRDPLHTAWGSLAHWLPAGSGRREAQAGDEGGHSFPVPSLPGSVSWCFLAWTLPAEGGKRPPLWLPPRVHPCLSVNLSLEPTRVSSVSCGHTECWVCPRAGAPAGRLGPGKGRDPQ